MDVRQRFAHQFRLLSLLRLTLVAGAVYDLGFAGFMVAAPELPGRWLGLPQPGEPFYLWILAVFLTMLAALYLQAARDPRRYSAIIAVAIGGRLLGAVAFFAAASGRADLAGLQLLAAADAAFALGHAVCWLPLR
jgi:hypothetical protein